MSAESEGGQRTVTPLSANHDLGSMNAIGWVIFLVMAVLLLPLLPILILVWLVSKAQGG